MHSYTLTMRKQKEKLRQCDLEQASYSLEPHVLVMTRVIPPHLSYTVMVLRT